MRELAGLEAAKVKAINPKFHAIHRKDADMDFANVLISELAGQVPCDTNRRFGTALDSSVSARIADYSNRLL